MPITTDADRIKYFQNYPNELLKLDSVNFYRICDLTINDGESILRDLFKKTDVATKLLQRFSDDNKLDEMLGKNCGDGDTVLHYSVRNIELLEKLTTLLERKPNSFSITLWEKFNVYKPSPINELFELSVSRNFYNKSIRDRYASYTKKIIERYIEKIIIEFSRDVNPDRLTIVPGVEFFYQLAKYHEQDALKIILDDSIDTNKLVKVLGLSRQSRTKNSIDYPSPEYHSLFVFLILYRTDFLFKVLDSAHEDKEFDLSNIIYSPSFSTTSPQICRFPLRLINRHNKHIGFKLLFSLSPKTRASLIRKCKDGSSNKYISPAENKEVEFKKEEEYAYYLSGLLKVNPQTVNIYYFIGYLQTLSEEKNNEFISKIISYLLKQNLGSDEDCDTFCFIVNQLFDVLDKKEEEQAKLFFEKVQTRKAKMVEALQNILIAPLPNQGPSLKVAPQNIAIIFDCLDKANAGLLYDFLKAYRDQDLASYLLFSKPGQNTTALESINDATTLLTTLSLLGQTTRQRLYAKKQTHELEFTLPSKVDPRFSHGKGFHIGRELNSYFNGITCAKESISKLIDSDIFYFIGYFSECSDNFRSDSLKRMALFLLEKLVSYSNPYRPDVIAVIKNFASIIVLANQPDLSEQQIKQQCARFVLSNENKNSLIDSLFAGISSEFLPELLEARTQNRISQPQQKTVLSSPL